MTEHIRCYRLNNQSECLGLHAGNEWKQREVGGEPQYA